MPFILQSSKQLYHALPRYAYGADLQADYTLFLISPPPPSSSSPNVPFVTSRPSTMSMAKHSLGQNASQAQGLSAPFAYPSPRPSTYSPSSQLSMPSFSPHPSTTSPRPSPSTTSTPHPSASSTSTTTPFIDTLLRLQFHLLQAPHDHLPSAKAREAMHIHGHNYRRGRVGGVSRYVSCYVFIIVRCAKEVHDNDCGKAVGGGIPSCQAMFCDGKIQHSSMGWITDS